MRSRGEHPGGRVGPVGDCEASAGNTRLTRDAVKAKTKAPEQTLQEVRYLKTLAESQRLIRIRLANNEELEGRVEFFDSSFIRLTRDQLPNLFVFKHDIKYLYELE